MRISTHIAERQLAVPIGSVQYGSCVRFLAPFHQDCRPSDRYILNDVISDYRPHKGNCNMKAGVTNLLTGKLSYVELTRKAIIFADAEVVTNEA